MGPTSSAFGITGDLIIRFHTVAHEGGWIIRTDMIDDGNLISERLSFQALKDRTYLCRCEILCRIQECFQPTNPYP